MSGVSFSSLTVVAASLALCLSAPAAPPPPPNCSPIYPPIGCFNDMLGPHALPLLAFESDSMRVDECVNQCSILGYPLAGLTGHATPAPPAWACYCGGPGYAPGAAPAPASDCDAACPGGGQGPCGANNRLSVYNFTCTGPAPGPPLAGIACSQPESRAFQFCNKSLSIDARVADLVGQLSLYELGPQLTAREAPAIPRLGIPSFYFGLNMIHGITNPVSGGAMCLPGGQCPTIWPAVRRFSSRLARTLCANALRLSRLRAQTLCGSLTSASLTPLPHLAPRISGRRSRCELQRERLAHVCALCCDRDAGSEQ